MLNRRCSPQRLYYESRISGTSFANLKLINLFRRRLRLPAGKGRSLTSGERIFYNADYQFNRDRLYIIVALFSGCGQWGHRPRLTALGGHRHKCWEDFIMQETGKS